LSILNLFAVYQKLPGKSSIKAVAHNSNKICTC